MASSASIWDLCVLDVEQEEGVRAIKAVAKALLKESASNKIGDGTGSSTAESSSSSAPPDAHHAPLISSGDAQLDRIQRELVEAEASSRAFVQDLDSVIDRLDAISIAHDSVTSKTNLLMRNCEDLVERQKSLQETIDSIQRTLSPFDGIEDAAVLLGMPSDAYGKPIAVSATALAALSTRPSGGFSSVNSSSSAVSATHPTSRVDLRSPEFRAAMSRIVTALQFLYDHMEIHDSARMARWLFQLQFRGNSLIAKELRELIENASKACADGISSGMSTSSSLRGDLPLESLPLYSRFRGLGKRARELIELLECCAPLNSEAFAELYYLSNRDAPSASLQQGSRWFTGSNVAGGGWGGSQSRVAASDMDIMATSRGFGPEATLAEVLDVYHTIRTSLLNGAVVKEMRSIESASMRVGAGSLASKQPSTTMDVGHFVRQAFSLLLRMTHLEFHLFDALFLTLGKAPDSKITVVQTSGNEWTSTQITPPTPTPSSTDSSTADSLARWGPNNSHSSRTEACIGIVDALCALISGELRAHIIHESSVDVLCRIITTLCDDTASQTAALRLPPPMIKRLESCIATSVSDALERLVYCTEVALRQEIQNFVPLPSHLNYPGILIKAQEDRAAAKAHASSDGEGEGAYLTLDDIARTWYPTLKSTLSLLSKLYGVVDPTSFEDFASRIIPMCTKSLQIATEKIRRGGGSLGGNQNANIHADFFSVRHLLILREQLTPFDMRFQIVENQLDFAPTGVALQHLVKNSRSLFKFDGSNAILQLARDGAPEVRTRQVDVRRELNQTLKEACRLLRVSAVSMILGPLESFLAKVSAFAGIEIPVSSKSANIAGSGPGFVDAEDAAFTPAIRATLKAQAFMKPDRIKSALDNAMEVAVEKSPELRSLMLLYVDNPISRTVLVKPVQHDIAVIKQKMTVVINSCVDPGQGKRDLEQLLSSVVVALTSDLAMLSSNQTS